MSKINSQVAKKFAEGKISFEELAKTVGFEEAKKIAYFARMAEKSFQEGI